MLLILATHRWPAVDAVAGWLEALLLWSLPVYTLLALRRYFARGWVATLFKGGGLVALYTVLLGSTLAGVFVYSALQL